MSLFADSCSCSKKIAAELLVSSAYKIRRPIGL